MSLINPGNLYSGGAVVFNQNPHTALLMNLLARKQAKEDAVENYYRDLDTKINPAGMRSQDVPVLMENEKKRKEFFRQNKGAILNPNLDGGRAQADFQSLYQGSHGIIEESKGEAEKYKQVVPILTDPDKRSRVTPAFMESLALHDKPIRSEGRKSFDPTQIDFTTPFDQPKYLKSFEDIQRVPGQPVVTRDTKNFLRTLTTDHSYDDRGKEAIANRAVGAYHSNVGFQDMIDGLAKDPKAFDDLNTFYKSAYGHPIDIAHPEELAVAYTLKTLQPTITTKETRDDRKAYDDYNFAQQKAMAGLHFGYSKQLQDNALAHQKELAEWKKKNGLTDGKDEEAWADDYINGLTNELGQGFHYKTTDGKTAVENEVKLDPTLKKSLTITNAAGKAQAPDKLLYNKETKQYRPVFYQTDDKYQPIKGEDGKFVIEPQLSQPISKDQLKLALGVKTMSKKQLGATMSNDKPAKPKKGVLD